MHPTTYRRLVVASVAVLAAVIIAVALVNPSGTPVDIPEPVESVFPLPGDTVVRQTAIEVDLPVGYSLQLTVDGIRIPSAEIGFTAATGRYVWQPGPTSLFDRWSPGDHEVVAAWDRTTGTLPDRGEFGWTFRVA